MVEYDGFMNLMKFFHPKIKIPSRITIANKIEVIYKITVNLLKEKMNI